jgi:hypothetical protein
MIPLAAAMPLASVEQAAPVDPNVLRLGQALQRNRISLEAMMQFFATRHKLSAEAHIESKYTPQDELKYIFEKSAIIGQLESANSTTQLKEVALTYGLYYLFKYLFIGVRVPLSLQEYNKYFPKKEIHSTGLHPDVDGAGHGSYSKMTLHHEGLNALRLQRIDSLFEELKTHCSYTSDRWSGAHWTLKSNFQ